MSEEVDVPKTVIADPDDPSLIMVQVYPPNATVSDVARILRTYPGEGQPFYAFQSASIPPAVADSPGADFTGAPLVSSSIAENEAAITAMLNDSALQTLPNDKVFIAT